jgi:hypothetical protein
VAAAMMTKQSALAKNLSERFESLPEAWLQNELFEQTKNYLARGRRFERLGIDRLNEEWANAFKQFVRWRVGPCGRDLDDTGAELRLRGNEFPTQLVTTEVELLRTAIQRADPIPSSAAFHGKFDNYTGDTDEPKH